MVLVRNLTKEINFKKDKKTILKNISFTCPEKGLILLYGNSGCGKTTLLNILEGLDEKYSGTVEILGKDLRKINKIKYLRDDISIIFQDSNFINEYTVLENIEIISQIKKVKIDPLLVETRLGQFEIKNIMNKKIETLSGGEKQILALILVFLQTTKIVFCDEPTGSVDENNEKILLKMLKQMSKERLVFVVSHNVDLYKKWCDLSLFMRDGELV